jgi:hypothetical protein
LLRNGDKEPAQDTAGLEAQLMTTRGLLWVAMVAALLGAAPALAETRPGQPKDSGVTQKGQDAPPKAQPTQTKPKVAPGKAKPFLGGAGDGQSI